ncbi:MAG: hypothetical protein HOD60_13205 [Candidatus Nitrosopelagicus sp.]|jgi:hypothetical protein|nr:hypothetical protein [Candidatus Nitrosopelagicus sp.]
MPCNQVCEKYRFVRDKHKKIYNSGASRCNGRCQIFISFTGIFCPCCGVKLRKSPRNKHYVKNNGNEKFRY